MRLFIAINFNQATKQNILAIQQRLQELGRGNFSLPENLHLTLAFLGEIAPNRLAAVCHAMDDTPITPMELAFDNVGRFRREGGDIWWVGLAQNHALTELQANLARNLAAQGFVLESRRFSPHVTLAREAVLQTEPDRKVLLGQPFSTKVNAMSLMRSEGIGGRLVYTEQYAICIP